ncbi:MAG: hypothetical protein M3R55_02960 [Acidobacteriota bacterium]|nr:hypothetical protein [Acidobacteriota bacterium]
MTAERTADHWARWVRALGILSGVLIVLATAEGYTIRAARAEIATLRAERDQVRTGVAAAWQSMAADDFILAGKWLDRHSAHPDYLQRSGGLCGTGQPDFTAMADYLLGDYVRERAAGRSHDAGIEAMRQGMLNSEEWKRAHAK